jgi:Ca2+-binding RTX toxin-like protein/GH24 family phage-related lysozyme (muramidase)
MLTFTLGFGGKTYAEYLYDLVTQYEGFVSTGYVDSVGHPTIGYGFDLTNSKIFDAVMKTTSLTATQQADLQTNVINKTYAPDTTAKHTGSSIALHDAIKAKMAEFRLVDSTLPTDLILTTDQSDTVFAAQVPEYEGRVNKWLAGIPQSVERAVLVSLAYNGIINAGVSPTLRDNVINGNRAEAWYNIRYESNGGSSRSAGIANRRYSESEHFGLYKDRSLLPMVSPDEARQIIKMYNSHRDNILLYESIYSAANAAFRYGEPSIGDIYYELQPAIITLKAEFNIPASFVIEEAQIVGYGLNFINLNGDGTAYDSASNDQDLLIGDSQNNILNGGAGADALLGLGGSDTLIGGTGNDLLIGGAGDDILAGGGGSDQFVINNGDGIDTITDIEAADWITYNGMTIAGRAQNLDNGNYKLGGYVLQKLGTSLFITSGSDSGVIIQDFFPISYDKKNDYTNVGITIPKEDHEPDNNQVSLCTPIALDLNGDGLQYIAYSWWQGSNAHFDIDNDGFAEGMEWLSPNDGFLVRDTNNNGVIDSQKEMFGDDSGTTAYYKLAQLDSNHDNKIDAGDTGFASLRIWQDLNSNGETEAGELKTLAELNIASLSLQLTSTTTLNGHAVAGTSSFTRTDGTLGNAADVLLEVHQTDSIYVGYDRSVNPALDLSNLFLPLSNGHGTLLPLHYAMMQDPLLKIMVSDLSNINIATQMHEVYDRINAILLEWGGGINIVPTQIDEDRNSAKMAVIKRYFDSDLTNDVVAADLCYGEIFNSMASRLLIQGALHSVFPLSYYNYETGQLVLGQTYDQILTQAKSLAPTSMADKTAYWTEILRILKTTGDSSVTAMVEQAAGFNIYVPSIMGTSGNDFLNGPSDGDFQGFAGDDTFHIGAGGKFVYNMGDGADTIILPPGYSSGDITIYFGPGISFNSLSFKIIPGYWVNTKGLVIDMQGGNSITLGDFNDVFTMEFADGTIKDSRDINNILGNTSVGYGFLDGTAGNDTFNGTNNMDFIDGKAGIDTVSYANSTTAVKVDISLTDTTQYGGDSSGDFLSNIENLIGSSYNDTLIGNSTVNNLNGGLGNDLLIGGAGADIIDGGDGNDTVSYVGSSTAVNVSLLRSTAQSGGDAAGDILSNIENIVGSAYNDTLTGNSGANVIDGGAGNDTINGGLGNDTVTGGTGANIFVINKDAGSSDIITDFSTSVVGEYISLQGFTTPVDFAHLNISQSGSNTIITLENSQTVTLQNVLKNSLTMANIGAASSVITGTSGNDVLNGTVGDDIINGLAGNDTISGGAGDDLIDGGAGVDAIDGGDGVDTVSYASSSLVVNVNLGITTSQGWGASGETIKNVENLIGSAFNDYLYANNSGSTIHGGDGNDRIYGGSGNDILYGDAGNDTFYAGDGDDTIYGGDGNDAIYSQGGNNLLIGGAGADALNGFTGVATASYAASASGVNINLTTNVNSGGDAQGDSIAGVPSIIGSAFDDTIIGDGFSNNLYGGAGNDLLAGMGYGGNRLDGGEGIDTVSYASSAAVSVNLAITTAQGWGASGDIIVNVENLIGSAFADALSASAGGSTISGGAGNDTITGKAGNDILYGNEGNDLFYGGDGDDIIYGNDGNDMLYGQGGNNILIGGAGADGLNGFTGVSTASYATSASGVNVNLATNINSGGDAEGDSIAGVNNLTGSDFDDILTGNLSANIISGGAGNDIIEGGAGADSIDGGAGTDTVSYAGYYNYYKLGLTVDLNLVGTAQAGYGDANGDILSGIENLTGSIYNDTLTGNSGNNILTGGGGSDNYIFGLNFGQDNINNISATGTTASGKVSFGAGIASGNLWFQKVGSDLEVDELGTGNSITISGWYGANASAQVASFTASGLKLDGQIAQLVSAMASYGASNPGFNPHTANQMPTDSTLQAAIANAWHG